MLPVQSNTAEHSPFLSEFLSLLPYPALLCTPEGMIMGANSGAEATFGHSMEHFAGNELEMLFTPEDKAILYPNMLFMALSNGFLDEEIMLLRRNGSRFMAMVHMRGYEHAGQSTLLVHVRDIDHEKQMEKILQEIGYKDLLRVANGVGHEIRNPLLIIGGYLRKMYTSCKATDEDDTYYQCIVDNLKKIEVIVRKIDFFTNPPKPTFFQTSSELVVELGLESFGDELREAGIHCSTHVQPRELPMDQNLIARALSILVENALDVLPPDGEIHISGQGDEQWYTFSVQDNGPGIPEDTLPSIFQPFFSTKPHGAGIDLAILKRIVDSHHGQVRIVSPPGQGTRFDIVLPLERRRKIRRVSLAAQKSEGE
jgi:PAS domain S-box-containing protein